MDNRSSTNPAAFVPEQAAAEPPAIAGRPFVPPQADGGGRPFVPAQADPGAGGARPEAADWFEQAAGLVQAGPPATRAGAPRTPRRMSDGDGHALFTHVAVPTQRVPESALRPTPVEAGDRPDLSGRTERIRLPESPTGKPAPNDPPRPAGADGGRPVSIGRFHRGAPGDTADRSPGHARPDPGAARSAPVRTRRGMRGPVIAGAVLAAAVALLGAAVTGSAVSGGGEDPQTVAAAAAAGQPAPAPGPAGKPARPALRGAAAQPKPAASRPAPAAAPRMIMIIRHAEKPGDTPGEGFDPAGNPDDHSLTPRGWHRARSLDKLFAPTGAARPGIARPRVIYAASPTGAGTGQRTRETVLPLAGRLGVPVNTSYGKGQESSLARAAEMQAQRGPVLISWQHGEIPSLVSGLKVVGPQPPASWPDSRYDVVWTFTQAGPGTWRFSQTPQLLLPGDSGSTIR